MEEGEEGREEYNRSRRLSQAATVQELEDHIVDRVVARLCEALERWNRCEPIAVRKDIATGQKWFCTSCATPQPTYVADSGSVPRGSVCCCVCSRVLKAGVE